MLLDPPPARPTPSTYAEARGVVALRQPVGAGAVVAIVRAWLDAWEHESIDGLSGLLSPDAVSLDGQGHGRAALIDSLRQRLQAHEYGRLAELDLLRSERIERLTYEDFDAGDAPMRAVRGSASPLRPPEMQHNDLWVRAPLEVTRVAGERLFGDVLIFVLRADEGKLRIVGYGEADEK